MKIEALVKELKEKMSSEHSQVVSSEFGIITAIGDGIATISGIPECKANEMLRFDENTFGLALNLEEDSIGAVILGDAMHLREGDTVERTGEVLSVPVGEGFLGRVVDPLMRPVDGSGEIKSAETYPVERVAPGVMTRQPVDQPLQTGITAIDALVPIGRGQRELIIGDRQTGKTAIAIDTILNQKGKDVICIYVAVGQKKVSGYAYCREPKRTWCNGIYNRCTFRCF
jgi:F-type H+-transporting ATPase subunit alpha